MAEAPGTTLAASDKRKQVHSDKAARLSFLFRLLWPDLLLQLRFHSFFPTLRWQNSVSRATLHPFLSSTVNYSRFNLVAPATSLPPSLTELYSGG